MKRLYWIDDNVRHMLYILYGAIEKMWNIDSGDEGIASKIIILGNACENADTDDLPTKEDETEVFHKLFDLFLEKCIVKDGPNENIPSYESKKKLIEDSVFFPFVKNEKQDIEEYKRFKYPWISTVLDETDYKKAKEGVKSLLDKLNIESGSVVGIDMSLLYEDIDRIRSGKRVLSMELCDAIASKNINCFIYSTEGDDKILCEKWKESYKEYYEADNNIKIYQRNDFMQKGNANIINDIEKLYKKQEKEEGICNDKNDMDEKMGNTE